jgi:hypothetical protein
MTTPAVPSPFGESADPVHPAVETKTPERGDPALTPPERVAAVAGQFTQLALNAREQAFQTQEQAGARVTAQANAERGERMRQAQQGT